LDLCNPELAAGGVSTRRGKMKRSRLSLPQR